MHQWHGHALSQWYHPTVLRCNTNEEESLTCNSFIDTSVDCVMNLTVPVKKLHSTHSGFFMTSQYSLQHHWAYSSLFFDLSRYFCEIQFHNHKSIFRTIQLSDIKEERWFDNIYINMWSFYTTSSPLGDENLQQKTSQELSEQSPVLIAKQHSLYFWPRITISVQI